MNKIYIISLFIFLFSCQQEKENAEPSFPVNDKILGLASPVKLQPLSTDLYLEDYFTDPAEIDSISLPDELSIDSREGNILHLSGEINTPVTTMEVYIGDTILSIPVLTNKKIYHKFSIPLSKNYESVQLKGNFNGWNPKASPMELHGDNWEYGLHLYPGEYQYLVVVEGEEKLDPFNDDSTINAMGGYNSRIFVGNPDTEKPFIYGSEIMEGAFKINFDQNIEGLVVLWENFRIPEDMIQTGDNSATIKIPVEATALDRSFFRIWAYNDNGLSNDMLVPLENGKIITQTSQLSRKDKQNYRMYFLMVDRFYDGNPENNKPVDDPMIMPQANYLGGDIEGVTKKINEGYFEDLNMNTVWLSPIGLNPKGAWGLWDKGGVTSKFSGYHGYWPAQSKAVDYRFGNDDDLRELIKTAHKSNENILLDYVANHIHKDHPVYRDHPDWATELYLPDGSLNTEKWDEYRLTTWFDTHLPTLDLENPVVYEAMSDSALYWFENFDIDGFRHDATKHIPEVFWRTLTKKFKQRVMIPENRSIYQIGETYGNAELIGSYVNSGELDAQFDFNVYDKAITVLINEKNSMEDLMNTLKESLSFYGYHNLMGYISGNQDRPRFISLADGSVDPGEDTKLAGWTRKITNQGKVGFQRLAQLHALNFSIPGIPVIYYGDEIGMPGGNDPDNRRMMIFSDLNEDQQNMKNTVAKLAALRKDNIALIYGDLRILDADEFTLTFERRYFGERVVVMFNNVSKKKNITVAEAAEMKVNFGSKKETGNGYAIIEVPPHGFEILTNK